jgi:hypothetical protein
VTLREKGVAAARRLRSRVTQKRKKKRPAAFLARPAGAALGIAMKRRYELHAQLQPSSQFSQQPHGQSQSGHPWQQSSAQQPPAVHCSEAGAVVVPVKPAKSRDDAMAKGANTLVNISKLTFWLMVARQSARHFNVEIEQQTSAV